MSRDHGKQPGNRASGPTATTPSRGVAPGKLPAVGQRYPGRVGSESSAATRRQEAAYRDPASAGAGADAPASPLAPFLPPWSIADDTDQDTAQDGANPTPDKDDTWNALLGEASSSVGRMGRVEAPRGLRLHAEPASGSPTLAILPFDTLVHVERKTAHGWYYVVSMGDSRQGSVTGTGCVEGPFVELDPPEPTAHLHHVKPGEMLKDIAALYYQPKRGFDWGADARLYVEAIWEANKTTGKLIRVGGELSWGEEAVRSAEQEKTQAIWQSVQPRANHAIWIPSPAFVAALHKQGAITGGSISHAAWETAKEAGRDFLELVTYGAGFQLGALEGAFGAAKDLVMGVVDLLGLVRDLIQSLLGQGLLGTAQSIGKKLAELFERAPALLQQVGSWFVAKWTQPDDFARGQFHGEVIGYILVQVLLAVLTMGGSATLQASGRFAGAIQVIRGLDAAGDILTFARGAARGAGLPAKVIAKVARGGDRAADAAADSAADATRLAPRPEHMATGDDRTRGIDGRKPAMETNTKSLDDRDFHNDVRAMSPTARHVVRQLESRGWTRIAEISPDDLVAISRWFGKEIGVVQSPYGKLRVILGTQDGILRKQVRPGEVFVIHTHPVMRSEKVHFGIDLQLAGKHTEAVIDWSGHITYYSKSGIKNPIAQNGAVEPLRDYQAAFMNEHGMIAGFAKVDILKTPQGTVIKVRE